MTLKEQITGDVNAVFLGAAGLRDFAEMQSINGREVPVIKDDDQLDKYRREGVYQGTLLLYVRSSDFPERPAPGDAVLYGKAKYFVESAKETAGVTELVLTQYQVRRVSGGA